MRKLFLVLIFAIVTAQVTNAQMDFGIKAGLNYNSDAIKNFKEAEEEYKNQGDGKMGYHAGIWLRAKVPVLGVYIRPELVYTALNNKATYDNKKGDYSFQKMDIPVLVGAKLLKFVNLYIGPSFQYVLSKDFKIESVKLKSVKKDNFTVGLQLGGGVEFGSLGVDVRWERGFSDMETRFLKDTKSDEGFTFDTRVNQIIFGVYYKF